MPNADPTTDPITAEARRLIDDAHRRANWKRWGPYLADRQWGTVREDYSADGSVWTYFTHDDARSRAYRWGEDGLLAVTDRECRLCFALALWNGLDPILKERAFGLGGNEGNHGEDVKELYYHLDSTPTHSYFKALYKYPQCAFPYDDLVHTNGRRTAADPEYEIVDTGAFEQGRYFDVTAEYAKASPNDLLIRITVENRGPEAASIHVLPTLWYRNSWAWGCEIEGCLDEKPTLLQAADAAVSAEHPTLGKFEWSFEPRPGDPAPTVLFTDNETNAPKLFGSQPAADAYYKDAFHEYLIHGNKSAVRTDGSGTKAAVVYKLDLGPGEKTTLRLRLRQAGEGPDEPFSDEFEQTFAARIEEADAFYDTVLPAKASAEERNIARRAYAGLLWTKQFYYYAVEQWLAGDPDEPPPPEQREENGRNTDWRQLFNRDVVSMPDSWEYPWYAAWDLAFHMLPMTRVDPHFAKQQLMLFLREWYMHPNGALPAYEFNFSDANPPVHAWACWRVYKMTGPRGGRDTAFLARCFQKLLMNFTWWVNRKDVAGNNIFGGGFLGLDNIGLFDRSHPGIEGKLEQADGTAWMAFYCMTMLSMALELAAEDVAYEDMASKFFEHFIAIVDSINTFGGTGLWDDQDGFYYDRLQEGGESIPLRVRSMVGIIPLFACDTLDAGRVDALPGFKKRMLWFLGNKREMAKHVVEREGEEAGDGMRLLAVADEARLRAVLKYVLDEGEFLSDFGVRSLSKFHEKHPVHLEIDGKDLGVQYAPGESRTTMFGGNSNWRGPIWFPLNYLLIESLERYHRFYGEGFTVECPTGSGTQMNLLEVSRELERRLLSIFAPGPGGRRPVHGSAGPYADEHWQDLLLFYEYFDGDTGRGCGASHQTGWTALVTSCIERIHRDESAHRAAAERAAQLSPREASCGSEREA